MFTAHPVPEPDWTDAVSVGEYLSALLAAHPMTFYDNQPPYYSPLPSEARFDSDLACAARAEGLREDAITELLVACHSADERIALDAYRDMNSGRWKVCPAVIPPWWQRDSQAEVRLWLPEWEAKWRAGKAF